MARTINGCLRSKIDSVPQRKRPHKSGYKGPDMVEKNRMRAAERERMLENYNIKPLLTRFPGKRCMNCRHAYDLAPLILGTCKCELGLGGIRGIHPLRRIEAIRRMSPWDCDKACKKWKERRKDERFIVTGDDR
jgi:hypothetical protein